MTIPAVTPRNSGTDREHRAVAARVLSIVTSRDQTVIRNALHATAEILARDPASLTMAAWMLDSISRAVREMAIDAGASAGELP